MSSIQSKHYKVINSKLVLIDKPLHCQTNYRYIPYNPINKPMEQDYFRATINQLIKKNEQLQDRIRQLEGYSLTSNSIDRNLKNDMHYANDQLQKQRALSALRGQQCFRLRQQNFTLKSTINELEKQLKQLKIKIKSSQVQVNRINIVLDNYSDKIEKLSVDANLITENTQFSDFVSIKGHSLKQYNIEKHPVIESEEEEDEFNDDFYTVEANSHYTYDDEFCRTPKVNKDRINNNLYKNRSVEQKKQIRQEQSIQVIPMLHQQPDKELRRKSQKSDNLSHFGSQVSQNLRNWENLVYNGSKFSSLDLLESQNDPIVGSLSGMFQFNKS